MIRSSATIPVNPSVQRSSEQGIAGRRGADRGIRAPEGDLEVAEDGRLFRAVEAEEPAERVEEELLDGADSQWAGLLPALRSAHPVRHDEHVTAVIPVLHLRLLNDGLLDPQRPHQRGSQELIEPDSALGDVGGRISGPRGAAVSDVASVRGAVAAVRLFRDRRAPRAGGAGLFRYP